MLPGITERRALWLVVLTLLFLSCGCARGPGRVSTSQGGPLRGPHPAATVMTIPHAEAASAEVAPGISVGEPATFENLTVFPVLAQKQADAGRFTTLPAALATGNAEVRELGGQEQAPSSIAGGRARRAELTDDEAPRVGTLVIENRGKVSIYVLAGTVLKGGRQDRQIAQDFVVPPGQTVPVDAFCVEQGRWQEERAGIETEGRFAALPQLANTEVRAAAQHEKDQGSVWSQVAEVNSKNHKAAETGSLMATLDAPDVVAERVALARSVGQFLGSSRPPDNVVGLAYAVDGRIKGVRWFANHALFSLFSETLINTAAADAVTARGGKPAVAPPRLRAASVEQFVQDVDRAAQAAPERREDTPGANVNDYAESAAGYRARTTLRQPAAAASEISKDYVAR